MRVNKHQAMGPLEAAGNYTQPPHTNVRGVTLDTPSPETGKAREQARHARAGRAPVGEPASDADADQLDEVADCGAQGGGMGLAMLLAAAYNAVRLCQGNPWAAGLRRCAPVASQQATIVQGCTKAS
jgi:hypothetical protein